MKSHRKELWFETKTRMAFVNITPDVEAALAESGMRLCPLEPERCGRRRVAFGRVLYDDRRTVVRSA